MSSLFKVAGVQMDVRIGDVEHNLSTMLDYCKAAAANQARLVVFPECSLTGYCFHNADEAFSYAESVDGQAAMAFVDSCRQHQLHVVFGMLEKSAEGQLFNSAVLVGPDGVVGSYRKIHLPFLGVDRFTTPGNRALELLEIPFDGQAVRVGLNICYDTSFPETARILSLKGADLILLPTNWPVGADGTARHIINARALENHVFFLAVNRIGEERGFRFIGQSRICDCFGKDLAYADKNETIIYAEFDPFRARDKSTINIPGEYELHRLADRRPEFYKKLTEPQS